MIRRTFSRLVWHTRERWWSLAGGSRYQQWVVRDLRSRGARVGEDCRIYSRNFCTEPYLIDIGNHVAIAQGVQLLTHDGALWLFRDRHPQAQLCGRVQVGDNCAIGINAILMPGTRVGANCIIGAGAVVRGHVADNSVVVGNPGRVIMQTSIAEQMLLNHADRLDTLHLPPDEREQLLRAHFRIDA